MSDIEKIYDFARNIGLDGRHEGTQVSAIGYFAEQQFEGVAALAGGKYQFVIRDDLALVSVMSPDFVPEEGARYSIQGSLCGAGIMNLCPGIEISEVRKLDS